MGSVKVEHLTKKFGDFEALKDINLTINEGEFFALLGPSGCGKTTTMRCIAGFEEPTSGRIYIDDKVVNDIPPNERDCGMVFQSYALFPHLNVFENVAYSLNIKEMKNSNILKKPLVFGRILNSRWFKYPKHIEEKVMEILNYVELDQYKDRAVSELSGGQQQRVALARALIMEPAVLLMDEPLSNLDQKLRHSMRNTIRRIQQELGITTIFVTHDQEEALSMADRVAVMSNGKIMQIGTPTEIYTKPKTSFIADFVGTSNIFKGTVIGEENGYSLVQMNGYKLKSAQKINKKEVDIIIRPENIKIVNKNEESKDANILEGEVLFSTFLGSMIRYDVQVGSNKFLIDLPYDSGESLIHPGKVIKISIEPERVLLI